MPVYLSRRETHGVVCGVWGFLRREANAKFPLLGIASLGLSRAVPCTVLF